jgi:multicomponent Na+:H+ antiporter subunit G
MTEWIAAILLVAGSIFMLLSALGTLRFPDIFTRMHAATKALSFGVGLMLSACVIYFNDSWTIIQALIIIIFIFLTAPVAAHMIGRVAYLLKVPLWEKNVIDELKDQYDLKSHELSSFEPKL